MLCGREEELEVRLNGESQGRRRPVTCLAVFERFMGSSSSTALR